MHKVYITEVALVDFCAHVPKAFRNFIRGDTMSYHSCKNWEQLHLLRLVIENHSFLFLTADVSELASDDGISQSDGQSLRQVVFGFLT